MQMENLWERDTFNNMNIFYLFNQDIHEYDMKEAGFSLTQEYQLLPEKKIKTLLSHGKEKRRIELGLIQREDPNFKEKLKKAFIQARKEFLEANQLDVNDIISIKKDAIFVTKTCKKEKFGTYIDFRSKNHYTSFIRLNKQIELYYHEPEIDVKGIREEKIEEHRPFLYHFLQQYFQRMESESSEKVIDFVRRFITKYKKGELEVGYYQRFSRNGGYDLKQGVESAGINPYSTDSSFLDITYNYFEVLLKLIKIPL